MTRRLIPVGLALTLTSAAFAAPASYPVTSPRGGDAVTIAGEWIGANLSELGLEVGDIAELAVRDRYTSPNGVTHIWLQQQVDGLDIENARLGIHVLPNGSILTVGDRLERNILGRLGPKAASLSPVEAVNEAARHLGLTPLDLSKVVEIDRLGGPSVRARFDGASLSASEIPVDLVWVAGEQGGPIRLAWRVGIDRQRVAATWPVLYVDASTGSELWRFDQVAHSTVATYRVYPAPFESPIHGTGHVLVSDPWDVAASPFGWHDTNGAPGPDTQNTTGNNVIAEEDLDNNNGTPGLRPDGGVSRLFDWAHDDTIDPETGGDNLEASIVNLFYWNNITHDKLYLVGFTEPAGNFQLNNYGLGGVANDRVLAQALDGSGTNNANFATGPDGGVGRMQMYRWTASPSLEVTGTLTATYPGGSPVPDGPTNWGAGATDPFASLEMVLVDDGSTAGGGTLEDGCQTPFVNAAQVAGKVALIERGGCEFGLKAFNAQLNGAAGVIIHNNAVNGDAPFGMLPGVNGPSVTTPTMSIGHSDGMTIRANLPGAFGEKTVPTADRDSDFDAGIIAHEYGHGWSNRLTGGPSTAACLGNAEQAGEGWSDFLGLMLTMQDAASCSVPRGVGTYSSFHPPTGPGIRRYRYSPDMGVNPFTYGSTNDAALPAPHGVGSVWATAVWDLVCNLVDEQGFDDFDMLGHGNGGNTVALQIVSDGLKLQPCSPGMIDARNAILAADVAAYGGAHTCLIWETFARRGFGFSASQGLSTSRSDQVEAFDMPASCPDAADVIFRDGFEIGDPSRWSAAVP